MSRPKPPLADPPANLRQRYRTSDGSWRLWWEPSRAARRLGFQIVELDEAKLTASVRKAKQLNEAVQRAFGNTPKTPNRQTRADPRSIDALIERYKSPSNLSWTEISDAHRHNLKYDFQVILDSWAGTAVAKLDTPLIHTYYETLVEKRGQRMAQRVIGTLRQLLAYARIKGLIAENPATDLRMKTPPPRRRLATWEEYDALCQAARDMDLPSMELACALVMFQGQRVTDVRLLTCDQIVQHQFEDPSGQPLPPTLAWRIKRSKDRTDRPEAYLQIHPEIEELLQAAIMRRGGGEARLVVRDKSGLPFDTADGFSTQFGKVRANAAKAIPSLLAPTLQLRDLRRTFSTIARRSGLAPADIEDALGNTSGTDPRLRQVYMPGSDERAARATLAVKRPQKRGTAQ